MHNCLDRYHQLVVTNDTRWYRNVAPGLCAYVVIDGTNPEGVAGMLLAEVEVFFCGACKVRRYRFVSKVAPNSSMTELMHQENNRTI